MTRKAIIADVQTLSCSNSFRNYHFLKITTEGGTTGRSEFDENFGSPGVAYVVNQMRHRLIGQCVMTHEHIRTDLSNVTRPALNGVIGQALGAIENALLDAKAKVLDVPCHVLLGGKVRDRIRVYWSHCVAYRMRTEHFSPPIVDLDGVRQISRDVRDEGYTALKTNISPDPALSDAARACLRCIAGHMIPASAEHGVPGADDPAVVAVMVASLNRDAPALRRVLEAVDEAAGGAICALTPDAQSVLLARLRAENPGQFGVVESVVARAYYCDDRVLRAIGMDIRPPFPTGYAVEPGDWSLLDPVRARGPIHRDAG